MNSSRLETKHRIQWIARTPKSKVSYLFLIHYYQEQQKQILSHESTILSQEELIKKKEDVEN